MNVTYVPSVFDATAFSAVALDDVVESIRAGAYANHIAAVRAAPDDVELKKHLPAWCFNGLFSGTVSNDGFVQSTGLFAIDIDDVPDIEMVRWRLMTEPSLVLMFVSPSGTGIKACLKIDPERVQSDSDFKQVFNYVQATMAAQGITIDPSCSDVRRLCFVSSDPNVYYNPAAPAMELPVFVPAPPRALAAPITDLPVTLRDLQAALAAVPSDDRATWISVGQALKTLPDNAGWPIFDEWSRKSTKYDARDCERVWRGFRADKTSYKAIFDIAAAYGWKNPGSPLDTTAVFGGGAGFDLSTFSLRGSSKAMRNKILEDVFVLPGVALLGQATVIYAAPNAGKTLLTLHMLITGLNQSLIQGNDVFYINADDTYKGLIEKIELAEQYGFHMLAPGHNGFEAKQLPGYLNMLTTSDTARGKVLVLDTVKKFTDLMDKKVGSQFMESAREFVSKGGTLILLAHVNKHKDNEGKSIYAGTSDLVDDADCAHMIDVVSESGEIKSVVFTNFKSRGDVANELGFTYSTAKGQSYSKRLESVVQLNGHQYEAAKFAKAVADKLEHDQYAIDGILNILSQGDILKTELINAAFKETGISKPRLTKILDAYSGHDYAHGHRWFVKVGAKNARTYSTLVNFGSFQPSFEVVPTLRDEVKK